MRITGFGVALQSYPVRDALWLAIDDGRLRGIELWVNLARRLPSPYDAAPLFLAAWASYLPRAPARADRCAAAPGFDGFHAEVHDQIAEGDKVVTRKTLRGRNTGSWMGIPRPAATSRSRSSTSYVSPAGRSSNTGTWPTSSAGCTS